MDYKRTILYRTSPAPTIPIPAGLRSTGHYKVDNKYSEDRSARDFVQVYWGIAGRGLFTLDSRQLELKPGEVFYYVPGDPHIITCACPEWEYRWFTLDGPLAAQITTAFGWPQEPVSAGPCPQQLFEDLLKQIRDISPAGQRIAAATAFTIYSRIRGNRRPTSEEGLGTTVRAAIGLMRERFSDPGLNISNLSAELRVHRATLSRLFHQETGLTCIEYLVSLRVQHALALLRNTGDSVAEVAFKSGFSDANYFCKAVIKATGHNPTQYRHL